MSASRRRAYLALLDEWGIDPAGNDYSGQEDARLTLAGDPDYPLHRFAAVTHSGEHVYVTLRETLDAAKRYAVENVANDLYAESPGLIVDFATGDRFVPEWDKLPWRQTA